MKTHLWIVKISFTEGRPPTPVENGFISIITLLFNSTENKKKTLIFTMIMPSTGSFHILVKLL